MKAGKIDPIAVVKGGQTLSYADFLKSMGGAAPAEAKPAADAAKPAAEAAKDAKKE